MALQTSGPISLNDIHVEAGGSSGTNCTINDSDIRGLIGKGSGATMSFNEWYGASAGPTTVTTSITAGTDGGYYSKRGICEPNIVNTGSNTGAAGWGSGSGWNTLSGVLPGVRLTGLYWYSYPAAGSPAFYVHWDPAYTNPTTSSTFANLVLKITNSGVSTLSPHIPIGSAAVSYWNSTIVPAYPSYMQNATTSSNYYTGSPSRVVFDVQWNPYPGGLPVWNNISTVVPATWTLEFTW